MSIALRLFESRAESFDAGNPRDPVVAQWFGGGNNTLAGVSVTPDKAMCISAVYACVRILSSAYASLPLDVFKRLPDGGREKAIDHPLYPLLHDQPNRWQTSYEYREMRMGHLLLRGNAYAQILSTPTRGVSELIPLNPDRVQPFRAPDGTIAYKYTPDNAPERIILQQEMHHIRGFSFDGVVGLSPIDYQRETLGLTLAADKFGASYFGNGTVVSGVLQYPGQLDDDSLMRLRQSWMERHQGVSNANLPAILEEGIEWKSISVTPEQSQFLETRKFQISEVARIFGVPPHMLADIEKATSWGTGIEQQGIGFVVYSLQPYLVRSEQAMLRDLFSKNDKREYYTKFNVNGLLRGDSAARAEYYSKALGSGGAPPWLTQDEVRNLEDRNPKGGDASMLPQTTNTPNGVDQSTPDTPTDAQRTLIHMHEDQLSRAMDRIVACEVKALRRAINAADGDWSEFERKAAVFYDGHAEFIIRHLDGLMGEPDEYARRHVITSIQALQSALETDTVRGLLEDWDISRSIRLTTEHAETALRGITDGN